MLHQATIDLLIIGFDLKKNSKQILAAYNNITGIISAFNLNLLEWINKGLGMILMLKILIITPATTPNLELVKVS